MIYYIKENIKKYPEDILRRALVNEGYSSQEIDEAFEQAKKPTLQKESLGFFIAVMLVLIFGVIVVVRPFIFLIIYFYNQQLIRYGLVVFIAIFLGWLCSAVMQKTTKKAGLRVFAGIMIAAIPTEIMIIVLSIWTFVGGIISYLTQIGGGKIPQNISSLSLFGAEITSSEVLVLSLMFFVVFNLMFLLSSVKEEKKGFLALYLLAPIIYIGMWYLVNFVLNNYLIGVLPKV